MADKPVRPRRRSLPSLNLDKPYPVAEEDLGHAIVINNLRSEVPQTAEDVENFTSALETVGFTLQCYNDCKVEEMRKIKDWITNNQIHIGTNCFCLTILCHKMEQGWILDRHRRRAFTIEQLTAGLSEVKALKGKAKILLVQESRNISDCDVEEINLPVQENNEDFFIVFSTFCYEESDRGPSYLQEFASHLMEHHMTEPLDKIAWMTKQSISARVQIPPTLEASELMELAGKISTQGMQIIAVQTLGFPSSDVSMLETARTEDQHLMKFKLLESWKNRSPSHSRQRLATLLSRADEIVDAKMVQKVLKTGETIKQFDSLTHVLCFAEFNKEKAAASETASSLPIENPQIASELQKLREEIEKLKTGKMFQETHSLTDYERRERGLAPMTSFIPVPNMGTSKFGVRSVSTHDAELVIWSGFTVLQETGQVVVGGTRDIPGPWSLFIYKIHDGKFHQRIKAPFQDDIRVLAVEVEGQEQLAVWCWETKSTKLLNLGTWQSSTAFRGDIVDMCLGDRHRLYAISSEFTIAEIDCSSSVFEKVRTLKPDIKGYIHNCCYLAHPHRSIVVICDTKLIAISCDTEQIVWSVEGRVDGMRLEPQGVLFSPQHDILAVADGENSRILILDAGTGSHLQSINLPDLGYVSKLCLYKDQLVVLHIVDERSTKISYISII